MSLDTTQLWHKRARPDPTAENFNVQLGCHLEEVLEMLRAIEFHAVALDPVPGAFNILEANAPAHAAAILDELATHLKAGRVAATLADRKEFLDSLADQIVTAVGVGHCANTDVPTALERVNASNWSKFDDEGQPIFNEAGKIAKGPNYKEPDLSGLY